MPKLPSWVAELLPILLFAGLMLGGYGHISSTARHTREAAASNATAIEAHSTAAAAVDTVRTIETYHNTTERIETRTRETNGNITSAPGAEAPISDSVYDAFVGALCLHDGRADDVCRERSMLHSDDPDGQPPEAGPSRADPR